MKCPAMVILGYNLSFIILIQKFKNVAFRFKVVNNVFTAFTENSVVRCKLLLLIFQSVITTE